MEEGRRARNGEREHAMEEESTQRKRRARNGGREHAMEEGRRARNGRGEAGEHEGGVRLPMASMSYEVPSVHTHTRMCVSSLTKSIRQH